MEDAAQLVASHGGSLSGEHGDGRARGELLPVMYSPDGDRRCSARSRTLFDPANLLNPGVLVDPAPLDADLRRPAGARRCRRGLGFAYPHDARRPDRRRAPLRRRRQVPGGHHRDRRLHVPVVPGDEGREGLHPRPRPRAAGDGERHARDRRLASPEVHEALDLCLSCKACSSDCPAGSTWPVQVRGAAPNYRGQAPPGVALRARLAAPLGRADRASPRPAGSPTPSLRRPAGRAGQAAAAAWTRAGSCPRSRRRRSARWFAERRRAARRRRSRRPPRPGGALGRHVHRLLRPEVGQAAVAVLGTPATRCASRAQRLLRPHLDHAPASWTAAQAQAPQLGRGADDAAATGIPIVGLEPSCTAVLRSDAATCCRTTRAPTRSPRDPHARRAARPRPRLDRAPDLSDVTGVAQPHCHQHAVMASTRTAGCSPTRARRSRRSPAAAGSRATSASRRATTTSRSRSPRTPAARAARRRAGDRRCWPTASPAAPRSTSWPASRASTWPSCWPSASARRRLPSPPPPPPPSPPPPP